MRVGNKYIERKLTDNNHENSQYESDENKLNTEDTILQKMHNSNNESSNDTAFKKTQISEIDNAQYRRDAIRAMGRMSQLGLTAVICVILSLLVGYALDYVFGVAPVFIIIFAFVGCASAIKTMIEVAKKF